MPNIYYCFYRNSSWLSAIDYFRKKMFERVLNHFQFPRHFECYHTILFQNIKNGAIYVPSGHQTFFGRPMDVYMRSGLIPTGLSLDTKGIS